MKRREFIAGLAAAVVAWPVRAQQSPRMRRIGALIGTPLGDPGGQAEVAAFVKSLAELGWVEGRTDGRAAISRSPRRLLRS
jgi:putative tryptophan/tyrosine transport system substrate-binding protein